jgi:ubiquinone/menaquinone biosynthesis C-methylase UbiE
MPDGQVPRGEECPGRETLTTYDANARGFAERQWPDRLARQMEGFQSLFRGSRVVDLGCGAGRDCEWLGELGYATVGVDLSAGMLAEGRFRVPSARFVQGHLLSLPLATESVDGAWVCSSLVHIRTEDRPVAIGEIARVLRPGGALYLGVEEGVGQEWRVISNDDRLRYYFFQPEELTQLLSPTFVVRDQFIETVGPWRFLTTFASRR